MFAWGLGVQRVCTRHLNVFAGFDDFTDGAEIPRCSTASEVILDQQAGRILISGEELRVFYAVFIRPVVIFQTHI